MQPVCNVQTVPLTLHYTFPSALLPQVSAVCCEGLQGIKMGDIQLTIMAFLSAGLFFVISNAKPTATLSAERPHPHIFCAYVFLSILGQFVMHTFFLVTCYNAALAIMPKVHTLLGGPSRFLEVGQLAAHRCASGCLHFAISA